MKEGVWQHKSLMDLEPRFTEFTGTKGVLRCLQPTEERSRATGLVFLCPWCKHDKNRKHYCIFLFDDGRVPPLARPPGRFSPTHESLGADQPSRPEPFPKISLREVRGVTFSGWLKPQDMACGFECSLIDGVVAYKPQRKKWFRPWK